MTLADDLAVARQREVAALEEHLEVRRPALLRLVGEVLADDPLGYEQFEAFLAERRRPIWERVRTMLAIPADQIPPDALVHG